MRSKQRVWCAFFSENAFYGLGMVFVPILRGNFTPVGVRDEYIWLFNPPVGYKYQWRLAGGRLYAFQKALEEILDAKFVFVSQMCPKVCLSPDKEVNRSTVTAYFT